MNQLVLFDYDQLDLDTRTSLKQRAERINERSRKMAVDIWENGRDYAEAQEELACYGYGYFQAWAKSETQHSLQTVYRFIWVYQNFDYNNLLQSSFAQSALYALAAPSTPDEARQEAIDRAEDGEVITHQKAQGIIAAHHSDPEPTEAETEVYSIFNPEIEPALPVNGNLPKAGNKTNRAGDIYTPQSMDACQTPAYALDPLLPHLNQNWLIWEPAVGEGYLAEALYDSGYRQTQVIPSDILTGQNFFDFTPDYWDCLITNPPYSIKYEWLRRCYQLNKPFALLLPVETLGAKTAQELFSLYGLEVIFMDKRINFKMPNAGWNGGGAQFPVAWFTWGLKLGKEMIFAKINK